jgi:hypothetical protein
MISTFNVKKSHIAFVAFLLIFVMDAYSYAFFYEQRLPIGFMGVLLAFLLVPFFISQRSHGFYGQQAIALLILFPIIFAYISGKGNVSDIYFWFKALSFFVMGYYFVKILYQPASSLDFTVTTTLLFFLCVLIVIYGVEGENYLRVSDAVILFSFYVISSVRSRALYVAIMSVTIMALYLIGSRFGLVSYLVAVSALFFIRLKFTGRFLLLALSVPIVFIAYSFLYDQFLLVDNINNNRLLRLIFETDQDTSLIARLTYHENAIQIFKQSYLIGDYKYYLDQGSTGEYAHNFLSFWSELGFLGVLISFLFFYLTSKTLIISYNEIRNEKRLYGFLFLITVYFIFAFLLAKSYTWMPLYFIVGVCFSYLAASNIKFNKIRSGV